MQRDSRLAVVLALLAVVVLALLAAVGCGSSGGGAADDESLEFADRAWARGDTTQAKELLHGILEKDPKSFPARYRLALSGMESDPSGAIQALDALAKERPEHPGPIFYAGLTRLRMNDYPGAERDLRRGYELSQKLRGYSLSDTSEAAAMGLASLSAGKFDEATQYFTNALVPDPDNPVLWYLKARSLANAGSTASATQAVETALAKRSDFPSAHALRAELLLASRQIEPAREELRIALEASPDHAWAHYQMGLLLVAENELRAAALELRKVILSDPTYPQPHQLLGQVFMRMEQGNQGMIHYQHFEWTTGFLQRHLGRIPGRR